MTTSRSEKPPRERVTVRDSKPFLKWAGGKAKLADQICALLPEKIESYYEPFLGGGAVFFRLASQGRIKKAILSDLNSELILTYHAVQQCPKELIEILSRLKNHPAVFEEIKNCDPSCSKEFAARMIYLNKTCYNGLYRVNSEGKFNVPFGRYANPNICDAETIMRASDLLQCATLVHSPFDTSHADCSSDHAVYLDPPYLPVAKDSFVGYTKTGFGFPDHLKLASLAHSLNERGVPFVLSNCDTDVARTLYTGLEIRTVTARRSVGQNAASRVRVGEILVTNTRRKRGRSAKRASA